MKFGAKNDNKGKKESIGKLRKTQLITTFGPGAIAEMPEYTVILGATDYWETGSRRCRTINEPGLQRLLNMKCFKEPYTSESDNPKGNPDIPAFRFPKMHFCPTCGRLDDYRSIGDTKKKKKCVYCNRELVPSRFVAACVNGHLEDFPFDWWVHFGVPYSCKEPDNRHKLRIEFKNNTGGLASIVIACSVCGKKRSMEGCMSQNALKGYRCRGRRPWVGSSSSSNDPEECSATMRALQRGASNVYFSVTQSALTIPPWSNRVISLLNEQWDTFQYAYEQSSDEMFIRMLIENRFHSILNEGRYTIDDFMSGIRKIRGLDAEQHLGYSEQQMYEDEYKALCEGYESSDEEEPEQFQAEIVEMSESLSEYFDEVVLVKRLREVLALRGFRRVTPTPPDEEEGQFPGANANEFTPVWNKEQSWLPAIEMRGEGIFVRLNADRLEQWETKNTGRYKEMGARLKDNRIGKGMFSARYVLLHTLSHLLIRQLTIDCGYQEAALKERIYSTYPEGEIDMAGILIYTSASDSDGSLGGLVRQGEPDLLEDTLRNALQEASWCSSDPLCIESMAQGYSSLNYAACHACTLLPETSCEARNCLLDRASIVGKPGDRSIGYFGDVMEDE